jgi:membrane protease YdiL (CAAX protease family)
MVQQRNRDLQIGSKTIAAWEIISVTLSFLMAEWIVRPFSSHDKVSVAAPLAAAIILMFISHRARGETLRAIGWRLDNFWPALRLLLLPLTAGAALILAAGFFARGFVSKKWLEGQWLLWLPIWGLVQQYALQGFVNRRAQIVFGAGIRSVLLVALVFALLHLPNPWLSIATFAGGIVSAAVYQRQPNLFALSLAHALMSLLLVFAVPNSILGGLRVGLRYFF